MVDDDETMMRRMGEGLFEVDVPEPGMPPIPITRSIRGGISREQSWQSRACVTVVWTEAMRSKSISGSLTQAFVFRCI